LIFYTNPNLPSAPALIFKSAQEEETLCSDRTRWNAKKKKIRKKATIMISRVWLTTLLFVAFLFFFSCTK